MVASRMPKRTFRPGKSSRANAYAESDEPKVVRMMVRIASAIEVVM
jgi:hypothetical protein